MHTRTRQRGFTLLETMISAAVLTILMATVFSVAVETSAFLRSNDMETMLQLEGERAMERLTDILRKSGRVDVGGVAYPRVVGGNTAIEFLLLADQDGNGYPFNAVTGDLEWSPKVFTALVDANGNFDLYDGGTRIYTLGRFIRNLRFVTVAENPALNIKEITVSYEASRTASAGYDVVRAFASSIMMRN
jgi:prepilin-type N-terminal cleavage/methylation domain-containing protein